MLPSQIHIPWQIGALTLPHRLIQGPLAGISCAPFRALFSQFTSPAYCVTEMISAYDILTKHKPTSRYLYRSSEENFLCYQLAGSDATTLTQAARRVEDLGADLIDLNCGCPKTKIRKKGAGSALLEKPLELANIISTVRSAVSIPLTVKIRIQTPELDCLLAQAIAEAGADAIIVHGRRWHDDYQVACNHEAIGRIKQRVTIPVIANGDIRDKASLAAMIETTGCDGFMLARAGTGQPWLYDTLLTDNAYLFSAAQRYAYFLMHLRALTNLENEHIAVRQSRTLIRYYLRDWRDTDLLKQFYTLSSFTDIENFFNCAR